MRTWVLAAALAVALSVGCKSKEATSEKAVSAPTAPAAAAEVEQPKAPASAPLVDITAQTSLKAVRAAFNAHKGEARFLTLLSPT